MKLSDERINELQGLLKELFDLDLTTERTREVGLAVLRFVIAKAERTSLINNKG